MTSDRIYNFQITKEGAGIVTGGFMTISETIQEGISYIDLAEEEAKAEGRLTKESEVMFSWMRGQLRNGRRSRGSKTSLFGKKK